MTRLIAALSLMLSLVAGTALAQAYPPNEAGVTMGHWHLNSRDIEANKKIFVAMGGTAVKNGNFDIVRFPGVIVFLNQGPGTPPAVGGTVGTVVHHVGFLVPNVQASIAKWKAAGVPVEPGGNGRLDQAFVTTPDGLRIEILEDKSIQLVLSSIIRVPGLALRRTSPVPRYTSSTEASSGRHDSTTSTSLANVRGRDETSAPRCMKSDVFVGSRS